MGQGLQALCQVALILHSRGDSVGSASGPDTWVWLLALALNSVQTHQGISGCCSHLRSGEAVCAGCFCSHDFVPSVMACEWGGQDARAPTPVPETEEALSTPWGSEVALAFVWSVLGLVFQLTIVFPAVRTGGLG